MSKKTYLSYTLDSRNIEPHLLNIELFCQLLGIKVPSGNNELILPSSVDFEGQSFSSLATDEREASLRFLKNNKVLGLEHDGQKLLTFAGMRKLIREHGRRNHYEIVRHLERSSKLLLEEYVPHKLAEQTLALEDGTLKNVHLTLLGFPILRVGSIDKIGEHSHAEGMRIAMQRHFSVENLINSKRNYCTADMTKKFNTAGKFAVGLDSALCILEKLGLKPEKEGILSQDPTELGIAVVTTEYMKQLDLEEMPKLKGHSAILSCLEMGGLLYTEEAIGQLAWQITNEECPEQKLRREFKDALKAEKST